MRGFAAVGLINTKYDANIGGALRAAFCYNAAMILMMEHKHIFTTSDTPKTFRHIPLIEVKDFRDTIPKDCVPVAVEITDNARLLFKYTHPRSALYIFGPENGTINKNILNYCRDIVYIPTRTCMNLAATVNVVLYDRLLKESMKNKYV